MKKLGMKSMLALVAALGIAMSGCSSDAGSDNSSSSTKTQAATDNLTDFDWVAFEMPAGWEDAKESDSYVTVQKSDNHDAKIKISSATLFSSAPTAADKAAEVKEKQGDYYGDGGTQKIGDYEWTLLTFTFNDNPSVKAYADVDEDTYVEVTIFEQGVDNPDVQTVLSTIKVDPAKA